MRWSLYHYDDYDDADDDDEYDDDDDDDDQWSMMNDEYDDNEGRHHLGSSKKQKIVFHPLGAKRSTNLKLN